MKLWNDACLAMCYNEEVWHEAVNTNPKLKYRISIADKICIAKTAARIWKERKAGLHLKKSS